MGFLSSLFGVDDEQARSDELDRQRAALNAAQRERRGEEWYRQTLENDEKSRLNVDAELNKAFGEGIDEGAANIRGTIGSIINLPFSLIPWQAWAIGAVVAFFYFGGGVLIRRKVTKA